MRGSSPSSPMSMPTCRRWRRYRIILRRGVPNRSFSRRSRRLRPDSRTKWQRFSANAPFPPSWETTAEGSDFQPATVDAPIKPRSNASRERFPSNGQKESSPPRRAPSWAPWRTGFSWRRPQGKSWPFTAARGASMSISLKIDRDRPLPVSRTTTPIGLSYSAIPISPMSARWRPRHS